MAAPTTETQVQDFATAPPPARPALNTQLDAQRPDVNQAVSPSRPSTDTTTLRRRFTRSNTVTQYQSPISAISPIRTYQRLEPGAEPGVDTKNDTDTARYHALKAQCQITVVDFSNERVENHELDNDNLEDFLKIPKEDWVACRWINVNGLSWDVVRLLGNYKQLHRLAIEDLLNTKSRTKVDWYADQAFGKSNPVYDRYLLIKSSTLDSCQAS